MRIDDVSQVSIVEEHSDGTLVPPSIEPGALSVVRVEPEDTIEAVLAVLAHHRRPVIIILPKHGQVFSQAEDFARLKHSSFPPIVSFVIPRERMPSAAQFAYNEGFSFTGTLAKAEASFVQQQTNQEGGLFASQEQGAGALRENVQPSNSMPQRRGEQAWQAATMPGNMYYTNEDDPATPLPESSFPDLLLQTSSRKPKNFLLFAVVILVLVPVSAALVPLFAQFVPSFLSSRTRQDTPPSSMGQLSFTSSGQLNPNSSTGLNDIVSLSLTTLVQPPPGMALYAWLLPDKTQDFLTPILLGKLNIVNTKAQLTYRHPQHEDLLVSYSRLLITEQDANAAPSLPQLDTSSWKYRGSIPDIPTPGDEQGYSLLSHIRHLLAKDPILSSLGLSGGLDIWLYRNVGKIFEWSNAARDDWASNNTDLLRRQVDRVVQYIDGQGYAWRDLPHHTPWLVDGKAGRPGLVDYDTAQDEQGPPSYLSHVRLHLNGMVNAPGHNDAQQQLASKIDFTLTKIEAVLKQVRTDAVQIAKMSNTQLKGQDALALLNDMQVNASSAYIGQTSETAGSVPGVVWIHNTLQQFAQMTIVAATPNGP